MCLCNATPTNFVYKYYWIVLLISLINITIWLSYVSILDSKLHTSTVNINILHNKLTMIHKNINTGSPVQSVLTDTQEKHTFQRREQVKNKTTRIQSKKLLIIQTDAKRKVNKVLRQGKFTKEFKLERQTAHGMVKIHNVGHMKPIIELSNVCVNGQKEIIVHGSKRESKEIIYGFPVHFDLEDVAADEVHPDSVAIFIDTLKWTFVNLNHFFKDFMVDYFLMIKKLNISLNTQRSLIFNEVIEPTWIKPLLRPLNISENLFLNLTSIPVNTCFKRAFFANTKHCLDCKLPTSATVKELMNHYLRHFNIKDDRCDKNKTNVLILNRQTNRRILNIDQLFDELKGLESLNVDTVYLESMTTKEQIQKIFCTDVLIGTHGAGLTWASFMKAGSHLLEIAWPTAGDFSFYYSRQESGLAFYPDVTLHGVEAFNITDTKPQKIMSFLAHIIEEGFPKGAEADLIVDKFNHYSDVLSNYGWQGLEAEIFTDEFILKHSNEILILPTRRYADVYVDTKHILDIVYLILNSKENINEKTH